MKNKKQIYILLPVVLLVWGIIGYRIFSAMSGDSDEPVSFNSPTSAWVDNAEVDVDYELNLDYSDPFLKNTARWKSSSVQSNNPNKVVVKPKIKKVVKAIPLAWPAIRYNGLIRKTNDKSTLYIIEINGRSNFMSLGEELEQLKLLKAYRDSIQVEFQGKEKRTILKL